MPMDWAFKVTREPGAEFVAGRETLDRFYIKYNPQLKMLQLIIKEQSYGSKRVLKDISLEMEPGLIYALLGANGAGKSTFYSCLYGLLPFEGEFQLNGKSFGKSLAASCGYAPTKLPLIPYTRALEYLKLHLPSNWSKEEKTAALQKSTNLIEYLNLDDKGYITDYSTGMKRKLAIILALVRDQPILALDEPFSGLDLDSVYLVKELIVEAAKAGKYVLISSHIPSAFTDIAHQAWILEKGQISGTYGKDEFAQLETDLRSRVLSTKKTVNR